MLGCVSAPGTPRFAACEQLRRRELRAEELLCIAEDADVGGGESVRMMQAAECDVLRGPLADAGDGTQAGDALLQGAGGFEDFRMSYGCASERGECGSARGRHTERAEVGGCKLLCGGEGMGEGGVCQRDWPGRKRNQLCGERASGSDADLLAENGADGDLKGIPSAGRAQAGLAAHDGGEQSDRARDGQRWPRCRRRDRRRGAGARR